MPDSISLQSLSRKEKISQLFIIGFQGSDLSEDSEILMQIREFNPGGVILFDEDMVHHQPVHNIKSPEQLLKLTAELQKSASIPLFIGIDQEGGKVNRLKKEHGFPETTSHAELGKQDDVQETFHEAKLIAETLSVAGINLNFAPVVDLAINEISSIIAKKERSFGQNAEQVIRHAEAYIKAHHEHNIITCCKHFPGHGSAEGDTHLGFVNVTDSWNEKELEPYKHLISKEMCPMIMTAHVFNNSLDENFPSTLSKNVLTDLLREKLQYNGVVISDDMQMKAISDHYGLKEALKMGFNAGLDMFCFGNNLQDQVQLSDLVQLMEELVNENEISEKKLDESAERVLKLKNEFIVGEL